MRFVMGNSKLPTVICVKVFAVSLVARVMFQISAKHLMICALCCFHEVEVPNT